MSSLLNICIAMHIYKHICCQMPIWFRIFGTVHVTKTTALSKRNEFSDNFLLIKKYYIQLLFLCNNAQLMIVIMNVIKYLIIESNCNKKQNFHGLFSVSEKNDMSYAMPLLNWYCLIKSYRSQSCFISSHLKVGDNNFCSNSDVLRKNTK